MANEFQRRQWTRKTLFKARQRLRRHAWINGLFAVGGVCGLLLSGYRLYCDFFTNDGLAWTVWMLFAVGSASMLGSTHTSHKRWRGDWAHNNLQFEVLGK